jgi:hypothetical protein
MRQEFAYPIRKPRDRGERKRMEKEGKEISSKLDRIEQRFYEALFDDTSPFSYMQIYRIYRATYRDVLDGLSKKVRLFKINYQYFHNQYKPYWEE